MNRPLTTSAVDGSPQAPAFHPHDPSSPEATLAAHDPAPHTSSTAHARAVSSRQRLLRSLSYLAQLLAALAVGYWFAAQRTGHEGRIDLPPEMRAARAPDNALAVTLAPVERRAIERVIEAVGTLHGYEELTLKTKISGRVAKVHRDFADRVKPGEILLELDRTDALLAVEQAQRALNSELARWGFRDVPPEGFDPSQLPTVVAARLRSDLAQSQWERAAILQNRGVTTPEETEQIRTNALVAKSTYENELQLAQAGAASARQRKAELDIARQQLVETVIRAPLPGDGSDDGQGGSQRGSAADQQPYTVTARHVTEGDWLAAGGELFRLVIDQTLKLRLAVPERHAAQVQVGQRVDVQTLTTVGPVAGVVKRVGPAVDQQTRTFQIEVEVPNARGDLKPGSFAKARIVYDEADEADTVPVPALVTFAGIHKVFVLDGDQVRAIEVKLGEQTPQWVEILEPRLPPGAQVVVSGNRQLAEGTRVRLREQTEPVPADPEAPQR
jgi:multidrug efflux pump subunit AcrA (membrane-fusion protein)